MKILEYIGGYFRNDKPQSIILICGFLIIITSCYSVYYYLRHNIAIDWYGLSAFAGVAFGAKTLSQHIDTRSKPMNYTDKQMDDIINTNK